MKKHNPNKTKQCTKCGEVKSFSEFYERASGSRRIPKSYCKSCEKAYSKEWFRRNTEKTSLRRKEYYEQNAEKENLRSKEWYQQNVEKKKAHSKAHSKENRGKINERLKKRYANDPLYKLSRTIRSHAQRLSNAVKQKKERRSLEYLGCTLEEFKAHIESQWEEGMCWENHAVDGWHLDHKKPIDWFVKNSDDPYEANHYTNFQPLWAKDNMSKGNKILQHL